MPAFLFIIFLFIMHPCLAQEAPPRERELIRQYNQQVEAEYGIEGTQNWIDSLLRRQQEREILREELRRDPLMDDFNREQRRLERLF